VSTVIWHGVLGPGEPQGWVCRPQASHMPAPQCEQMPRLSQDSSTSWDLAASKTGRQVGGWASLGRAATGPGVGTTDGNQQCWGSLTRHLPTRILPPRPSAPSWSRAGQVPWQVPWELGHGSDLHPGWKLGAPAGCDGWGAEGSLGRAAQPLVLCRMWVRWCLPALKPRSWWSHCSAQGYVCHHHVLRPLRPS